MVLLVTCPFEQLNVVPDCESVSERLALGVGGNEMFVRVWFFPEEYLARMALDSSRAPSTALMALSNSRISFVEDVVGFDT